MTEPTDPFDAGLRLARALEDHGLSYAIGGALAYGLWGVPRSTIDVDINVFISKDMLPRLFTALETLPLKFDREEATLSNAKDGMFSAQFGLYRIDVFTASIDFAWEAERTKVCRRVEGQELFFLYTDGVTEAPNPQWEQFGVERLKKVIEDNLEQDVDALNAAVVKALHRFMDTVVSPDDICCVAVEATSRKV